MSSCDGDNCASNGPQRVFDGNTATTAATTKAEVNPWIVTDLGAVYEVAGVALAPLATIANAQNLNVLLSNTTRFQDASMTCATGAPGATAASSFFQVTCVQPVSGRCVCRGQSCKAPLKSGRMACSTDAAEHLLGLVGVFWHGRGPQ